MNLGTIAATFVLIALGELPDKTMFASMALASRGRPMAVWCGASLAFVVHVAIAVTVGGVLVALVPHRTLQIVVGVVFLGVAAWSWASRHHDEHGGHALADDADGASGTAGGRSAGTAVAAPRRSARRVVIVSATTIFVAEWGDITQVLTAQLAARGNTLSVAVGSTLALLAVAAVAVSAGRALDRAVSVAALRTATAGVLAGLGVYILVDALT